MIKRKVMQFIRLAEGGMKEHFFNLLENLDQEKFSLSAVGPLTKEERERLEKQGIKSYYLPVPVQTNIYQIFSSAQKLKKILAQEKPDILHVHSAKCALITKLALKRKKSPFLIFTVHNFIIDNYRRQQILLTILEKILLKSVDKIITVSFALTNYLKEKRHIPQNKIVTIYNGICLEKFQTKLLCFSLQKEFHLPPDSIIVGTVSRLIPEKGIEQLLQVASNLEKITPSNNIFFLIIGDGPYRCFLEQLSQQLKIEEKVIFTGYRQNIVDLLQLINIFVLPSLSEGLGISLLEAMAMEKPVLGTKIGGIPEIIKEKVNGFLFTPYNVKELEEKILYLSNNKTERLKMGKKGRELVEKNFSLTQMIKETEKTYSLSFKK